ncbi:hypothetical protein [Fischerella thermalis]|nr:hypothetical protein [Fischerella thermalis]
MQKEQRIKVAVLSNSWVFTLCSFVIAHPYVIVAIAHNKKA